MTFLRRYTRLCIEVSDLFVFINPLISFIVVEFPTEILVKLVDKMSEIEFRLSTGANENIQLTSLISAFQYAKELYPPESA